MDFNAICGSGGGSIKRWQETAGEAAGPAMLVYGGTEVQERTNCKIIPWRQLGPLPGWTTGGPAPAGMPSFSWWRIPIAGIPDGYANQRNGWIIHVTFYGGSDPCPPPPSGQKSIFA